MSTEAAVGHAHLAVGVPTRCAVSGSATDLDNHYAIRHEVFVDEQRLFLGSDRDERDALPGTVHVLGHVGDHPAGAVRLYPLDRDAGLWLGDRLAVRSGYRTHGLGAPLVRYAVATAGVLGGRRMEAHVQVANVVFFTHLGWAAVGPVETYVGQPHQRMTVPLPDPAAGARLARRIEGEVSAAGR